MKLSPSKSGIYTIGGKTIQTDSLMEARIIKRLEANGFNGTWDRPGYGITHGPFNYTPDVELSVQEDGLTYRAWVEFKAVRKTQFGKEARLRMCGASRHYRSILLFLYVERTKQWYKVDQKTAAVKECPPPKPGYVDIQKLSKPTAIPSLSYYRHSYRQALKPFTLFARFFIDVFEEVLSTPHKKRRRR